MSDRSSRPARRRLSVGASALIAVGLVLYTQLGPWVSQKFGIHLPGQTPSATSSPEARDDQSAEAPKPREFPRNNASIDDLPPGGLKSYGDVKVSRAGLRYVKERSEHRLDHVMRHTKDSVNRPVHGVFDARDQTKLISVIDEAYLKATSGGRGVQREQDGKRTVYTVDMNRRVGFIGGQKGKRTNHPACSKVKLILEDKNVITAYPVD